MVEWVKRDPGNKEPNRNEDKEILEEKDPHRAISPAESKGERTPEGNLIGQNRIDRSALRRPVTG